MASSIVVIGGTNYTSYVESIERSASLEKPGATVSIIMNSAFPKASINPWDSLSVTELSVLTLTGFVSNIVARRAPAQTEIRGMDSYKRARDWFIDDQYVTSGSSGLTVGYYVNYFCNLCGLSYSILDATGSAFVIRADIPMGLRPVSEALIQLCGIAQWQMRVNAAGTLIFDHLLTPLVPDFTISSLKTFEEEFNDTDTRNVAKIWGGPQAGSLDGGNILYQESRTVAGIPDTRAMLFSAPAIDTMAKARSMATAGLDQWARLEHIAATEIIGNPNIHVGSTLRFDHTRFTFGSYLDSLTDLRAKLDPSGGYNQSLTSGRRAYRYPYWPLAIPGETFPGDGQIFRNYVYDGIYQRFPVPTSSTSAGDATGISDTPTVYTLPASSEHGVLTSTNYAFWFSVDGNCHRYRFSDATHDNLAFGSSYPLGWCVYNETTIVALYETGTTFSLKSISIPGGSITTLLNFAENGIFASDWPAWLVSVQGSDSAVRIVWDEKVKDASGDWLAFKIHSYNMSTMVHVSTPRFSFNNSGLTQEVDDSVPFVLGRKVLFYYNGFIRAGVLPVGDPQTKSLFTFDISSGTISRIHEYSNHSGMPVFGTGGSDYYNGKVYIVGTGLIEGETSLKLSVAIVDLPSGAVASITNSALAAAGISMIRPLSSRLIGIHFLSDDKIRNLSLAIVATLPSSISSNYLGYSIIMDDVGKRFWEISGGNLLGISVSGAINRTITGLFLAGSEPVSVQGNRIVAGSQVVKS